MQVEDDRMPLHDACERGQEPGAERVGVHGERDQDRTIGCHVDPERSERIVLEQRELAREAHDGGSRLGRACRLGPHDEHAAELLLEALHALRDGRRRDAQPPRRRIERALVDDDGEGACEVERDLHLKLILMLLKNLELDCRR